MNFGRHEDSTFESGKGLPQDWSESFTQLLTESYNSQAEEHKSFFHVYGQIYTNELLVIVSFLNQEDQMAAPKTLFISHDIVDEEKTKKVLDDLIAFTGVVFDDIFATVDWNNFCSNWTENKFNTSNFYYKVTRENISLTLQAEEILQGKLPQ